MTLVKVGYDVASHVGHHAAADVARYAADAARYAAARRLSCKARLLKPD